EKSPGATGWHNTLLPQRLSGVVHGGTENALGHQYGGFLKTPCIDIPLERLRLSICWGSARGPLGQMCRHHRVALCQQRPAALNERRSPTRQCGNFLGLGCPGGGEEISRVAVPPSTPLPQQIADDEFRMIIAGAQVRARRKFWIGLDSVENLLRALPGIHAR